MGKRLWLFLTLCLMTVGMAFAQKQITGVVIEAETGEPVVGASVMVKGTSVGAATDLNGKFSIKNVPDGAKSLVVSYIGMTKKEVAVKSNLRIYLESDSKLLQEQIVVAYGTATKESFTGSAKVIGADVIENTQKSNALDALQNKVAGVQMYNNSGQPGQTTPSIRIRGISSINAENKPLIILDGAPFDGDMNTLNPSDIESMTVLKDAASNALYGARGANGVIMITTKKAKVGDNAKITVDAKWGANSRSTQRYKTINSAAQYYETYYQALKNQATLRNGLSDADAHAYALANLIDGQYGLQYNVYNVPEGQTLIGTNGKLNPNATMGNLVNGNLLVADDWQKYSYKTGLRQEYNVTATQSTDKMNFYASVGYLNNKGIVVKSDYERISARVKADAQLKPWLKIGANVNYAHYKANSMAEDGADNSSGNILAVANAVAPIYPMFVRDAEGQIIYDENAKLDVYDYGDKSNAGLERPSFTQANALGSAYLDENSNVGNALNGVFTAEIKFYKDLKFTSLNTVSLDENRETYLTNGFYGSYASSNGILTKTHTRDFATNFQQVLNYHHEFNGGHDLEVMVGHEAYYKRYNYLTATRSNMLTPDNLELAGTITDGSSDSYTTNYNTEGYFGRAMYNYDSKYFVSASYRRDASSRFAKENRWGNFWSAGAAWLINKENFFKADWVDMLKVKVSYGSQGNDGIGDFRYTNTNSIVNASGNVAVTPLRMGNRDITWETNGNLNAGAEFEFFGGRLNGNIEFFYRKTTDMLFSFPLPTSYGYSSYYANVGDMRNQGIEVELDGDIIRTKDWTWNVNVNLTHYRNKITYLPEQRKTLTVDGVDGYNSGMYFYGEGIPMYTYYMQKYAGVYSENNLGEWIGDDKKVHTEYNPSLNGKPMWYRNTYADGDTEKKEATGSVKTTTYSDASRSLCGSALPDLYGGFGTTLRWRDIDFGITFGFQIGGLVYDSDYAYLMHSPYTDSHGNAFHADILNSWSPDNADSDIPALVYSEKYAGATSDRWLTNASYLSIDNISFGWTLPRVWTRSIKLDKIRLYFNADNVFCWSKRQGLDPRQSISGSATNAYYAPMRSISGGIQIAF